MLNMKIAEAWFYMTDKPSAFVYLPSTRRSQPLAMRPKHHVSYNDVIVPYKCTYSDFRTLQRWEVLMGFLLVAAWFLLCCWRKQTVALRLRFPPRRILRTSDWRLQHASKGTGYYERVMPEDYNIEGW